MMGPAPRPRANHLEHLGRLDSIEFGPELERRQRIEEGVVADFPLNECGRRIENAERDAGRSEESLGHLDRVRKRMPERHETVFGLCLRGSFVHEPRSTRILRQDRFQVAVEHIGAVTRDPHRTCCVRDRPASLDPLTQQQSTSRSQTSVTVHRSLRCE